MGNLQLVVAVGMAVAEGILRTQTMTVAVAEAAVVASHSTVAVVAAAADPAGNLELE